MFAPGDVDAFAHGLRTPRAVVAEELAFQWRAVEVFDDLRVALGDRCGEFWFAVDAGDRLGLRIGVARSGDPPAGQHVSAAKLVLKRQGLLDRTEFIPAPVGKSEILSGFERVSAVLGGTGVFARASLRSCQFGRDQSILPCARLVIETRDGLNKTQQAIVDAAVAAAGVAVMVEPCLDPGPEFAPLPARETEWAPLSVKADGRSLLVGYRWGLDLVNEPSLSLNESKHEIRISIALPDTDRDPDPDRVRPAMVFEPIGNLTVRLAGPVAGRRITGPGSMLGGSRTDLVYDLLGMLPDGTKRRRIPSVVGLATEDAIGVLGLQGFQSRLVGEGAIVLAQDPSAEEIITADGQRIEIIAEETGSR